MRAETIYEARNIVGESIVWHAEEAALYWVDIVARNIHRLEPRSRRHDSWPAPDFPTSIGLRKDGGFVVGLRRDVCLWRPGGGFEAIARPEPHLPDNRLNEGRVAPDGSFWVGTMQDNIRPDGSPKEMTRKSGALYRIDIRGEVSRLTEAEYGICNTMAWLRDGRFLFADTLANTIYQCRYNSETRTLAGRSVFAEGFQRGLPDGSCLDVDDNLWNSRVAGGACVAQYRPNGALAHVLEIPATWPTSCAFGGPDLSTLYVTSARFTMTAEYLAAHPEEGALFALKTATRGRPENLFG
jgi:sugar lactone lactonase YvrE